MAARKRSGTKKAGKKTGKVRRTKTAGGRKAVVSRPASRRGAPVRKKKGATRKAATKGTARKPTRRRVTAKGKGTAKTKARPARARGGKASARKAAAPRAAVRPVRPAPAKPVTPIATPAPVVPPPRPLAGPGETITEIGRVTHYFGIPHAAVVEITSGELEVGDTIRVKGHTTDFSERVTSLQVNHKPVERARVGDVVGLEVKDRVREHDIVYKVTTS
jgi:hypothetical protein